MKTSYFFSKISIAALLWSAAIGAMDTNPNEWTTYHWGSGTGTLKIALVKGDVLKESDANYIVVPADPSLMPGGGLDSVIQDATRGKLFEANMLRPEINPNSNVRLTVGQAIVTLAMDEIRDPNTGDLVAIKSWISTIPRLDSIIQVIGPNCKDVDQREQWQDYLRQAYTNSLRRIHGRSEKPGIIIFPSISTGAYGCPLDEAARIAIEAVAAWIEGEQQSIRGFRAKEIRFVLRDDKDLKAYQVALAAVRNNPQYANIAKQPASVVSTSPAPIDPAANGPSGHGSGPLAAGSNITGQGTVAEFTRLVQNSNDFAHNNKTFPTTSNRIAQIAINNQSIRETIAGHARNVRPILAAPVVNLINGFLEHTRQFGSVIEQQLYANMTFESFINRLLEKRPLMFMTDADRYILRNGQQGYGGFEVIGTQSQRSPLVLEEYLSYEEMQIAALLGVSVPTYFINNGNRNNAGQKGAAGSYQEQGIYTGLVGARFERPNLMEWQHMMITPQQNSADRGYGHNPDLTTFRARLLQLWSQFYNEVLPTFEEAQADTSGRYIKVGPNYFNAAVYKKRIKMSILPFLMDANNRGQEIGKRVFCRAVGIGLGVWQVDQRQAALMMDAYAEILGEIPLPHIADIDFIWFNVTNVGGVSNGGIYTEGPAGNNIAIHFTKNNPADKLVGPDADKLLVAMYAWDGNSYPGNEYWGGMLTASGDPAAASCSTIPELQNSLVNPHLTGVNLFVAGGQQGQAPGAGPVIQQAPVMQQPMLPQVPQEAIKLLTKQ